MNIIVNPYALVLALFGAATIIMSILIAKRLKISERSFATLLGLGGWWALAYSFELFSSTYQTIVCWLKLEYLAISFLSPALLTFIYVFVTKKRLLIKPRSWLIFLVPILNVALVWTNEFHHFYYKSLQVDTSGDFPLLAIEPALCYYLFTGYFYLTVAWSIYYLFTAFKSADKIYQKQKNIILYALIVPWIFNILYKFGISPNQNIDLTPFAFIATTIIISYGLLKFKLLDIIPAAREAIFESMQDGVLVLDTTGKIIDHNLQMQQMASFSEKRIKGSSLREIFAGFEALHKAVAEQKKSSLEIKISNEKVDSYFEVDINILLDKTSEYAGCILIFNDITRRKKDALSLVAINELKDRLFSIIAHDLRSPLINIMDMVKMIDEKVITEEEFKLFLPELSRNLNYTSSLLDNLLHWSKSQLKGQMVNKMKTDLQEIVKNEVVYYEQKAAEKGISIRNEICGETNAFIDAEMIRLVIRNLIANAIKYCNSNDSITISSKNRNGQIMVCVEDTGRGMKPEIAEKLFMLQTFTTRGTNNEQGTGLGLQLCKDFVEKNNGKIWVTTEWGSGSRVFFTVPLYVNEPAFVN